jgi:hypothetical protein
MKMLKIDSEHYAFPEGIKTVEEFVEFVNNSSQKFIKMTMYSDMNCVAPYFIEEDKKTVYVNFGQVTWIEAIDGKVMLRIEYERRLREVIREKCVTCEHFKGDPDNLDGHYERLCLDGHCWSYEKRDEDEG